MIDTVRSTLKPSIQISERSEARINSDNWKDDINIRTEYAAYSTAFYNILKQFQDMCAGYHGEVKTATHRFYLPLQEVRLFHAKPYRTGPKAREAQEDGIDKMLSTKVVEPAQTECPSPIIFVPEKDRILQFA